MGYDAAGGRVFCPQCAAEYRSGYLFAILFMTVILMATSVAALAIGRAISPGVPSGLVFVTTLIFSAPARTSEEIGWRGYALPRLTTRFGLRRASLILGPVWAAWHLPLFFVPTILHFRQSFPIFVLYVTALSVIFAWLYLKTNGSLLLAALLHTTIDQTILFLPPPPPVASLFAWPTEPASWLFTAFMWVAAGYFLVRMPRELREFEGC